MKIQKRMHNQIKIVTLDGRLDAHQTQLLNMELTSALTDGCITVINLGQVNFIDSSGLAILVRAMKHHREHGGELLLCALRQPVQIIFELTKLDRVFDIYPTEAAALQTLAEQSPSAAAQPVAVL